MKAIKNEISQKLSKRKWYNPNSYTPTDSAVFFVVVILSFFVVQYTIAPLLRLILDLSQDYYLVLVTSTIISQSLILIIAIIASKIRNVGLFSGGDYVYKFNGNDVLFSIILAMGVYCVFNALHYQFVDDIFYVFFNDSFGNMQTIDPSLVENSSITLVLFYAFIMTPIIPAICEELLFRGVILRGLSRYGAFPAVIIASASFAIMHGSFEQMILQFVGGFAICAVVYLTKNFFLGAVMHFTNNLFVLVHSLFYEILGQYVLNAGYFIDAFSIIFGIISIVCAGYYFIKKAIKQHENKVLSKELSIEKVIGECVVARILDGKITDYQVVSGKDAKYECFTSDKDNVFYTKKSFCKFNRFKNLPLEICLLALGFVLAIVFVFVFM